MLGVDIAESDEDLLLPQGVSTEGIEGEKKHRNYLATGLDRASPSESELDISMISCIDQTVTFVNN